jgi:hypothetical protein
MENLEKVYSDFNSKIILFEDKNKFDNTQNEQIIELISKNINNILTDKSMAKEFFDLIFSHEKMAKECLTFNLLNYKPKKEEKISDINKFVKLCEETLKQYQYKIGGFSIEDEEWFLADSSCKRFKVKENQKILYNSVSKKNYDKELIWFLDSILNYMKNFSDEIRISYDIFEDEKNCICWIIYKFRQ